MQLTMAVAAWAVHGAAPYASARAAEPPRLEAQSRFPNLLGDTDRPLRYRPDGDDFVIDNGAEFFNRPLYGGNSAFRVDGGDRPEFSLYLPGRGGNLRLGVCMAAGTGPRCLWLHDAARITTRYRPGELHYEIRDARLGAGGRISVVALAYAATEGLGVKVQGAGLPAATQLVVAFGAGDGKRGRRDGDIGTEAVPIGEYFQFSPDPARGARIEPGANGFRVVAPHATISITAASRAGSGNATTANATGAAATAANATAATAATTGAVGAAAVNAAPLVTRHDAAQWQHLDALLGSAPPSNADVDVNADAGTGTGTGVAVARIALAAAPVHLAVQVTARAGAQEQDVYLSLIHI